MTFRISIILLIFTTANCFNYGRVTSQLEKNLTNDFLLPFKRFKKIDETNINSYDLFKTRIEFVKLAEQYIKSYKPFNYIQYKPYSPPSKIYNYNKDYINTVLNSLNLLQAVQNQTQAISSSTESTIVSSSERPIVIEKVTLANVPSSTTEENFNMETSVTSVTETIPVSETRTPGIEIETTEESLVETTKKFETATVNIKEGFTEGSIKETTEIIENTTTFNNNNDFIKPTTNLPLNLFEVLPFVEESTTEPINDNFQTSSTESRAEELTTESRLLILTTISPISENSYQYYESILEASAQVDVEGTTQASLILETSTIEETIKLNYESTTKSNETSTNLNITEIGTTSSVTDIFTTEDTLNSFVTESSNQTTEVNEESLTISSGTETYYSITPSSLTTILNEATDIAADSTTDLYTTPLIWSITAVTSSEETTTDVPKHFTLETVTKPLQETTENVYEFLTTSALSPGDYSSTQGHPRISESASQYHESTLEVSAEVEVANTTQAFLIIGPSTTEGTINLEYESTTKSNETSRNFNITEIGTTTSVTDIITTEETLNSFVTESTNLKTEVNEESLTISSLTENYYLITPSSLTTILNERTDIAADSTADSYTTPSIWSLNSETSSKETITEIQKQITLETITKQLQKTTENVYELVTTSTLSTQGHPNPEETTENLLIKKLPNEISKEEIILPTNSNLTELVQDTTTERFEPFTAESSKETTTQEIIDITTVISNSLESLNINEIFIQFPRETLGELTELGNLSKTTFSKSEPESKESAHKIEISAQKPTTELFYPGTTTEIPDFSTIAAKTTESLSQVATEIISESTNEPEIAKVENTTQMSKNVSETTINVARSKITSEYNDFTTESNFETKTEAEGSEIISSHEITPETPTSSNSIEMPVLNSKRSNEQINANNSSPRFSVDELLKRNGGNRQNEKLNRKAKKFAYATDVMPSLGDYDIN